MAQGPYYVPPSIAPILEQSARTIVPVLSQPSGLSAALPALGALSQTGLNVALEQQKKRSLMQAQSDFSDYLTKLDSGIATPDDHRKGYQAALSLGITPPRPESTVSPDIWAELQNKAGVQTKNAGTKSNVQAAEALARLKDAEKAQKDRAASAASKASDSDARKIADAWQKNINNILPNIAKRGSPLGIAAVNNQRKDRLLEIAKNSNPTPQEVKLMETDLAGVMQGGSPQEDTLRATHYGSIAQDWAQLKGKLTGTPQDANSPDIVKKLKEIAIGVGAVDNKVITDNLKTIEKYPSMTYLIKKDPQGWENFKQTLISTIPGASESPSHDDLLDKYGAP